MSSKVTGWVWDQDLPLQRKCVLLWLAERATDSGVCFPGQAEIRRKTGLSESMVRRYLHWLASDQDESGQPRQPLVRIIQRRVAGERNTSNVYVLLVPWADATEVQRELEELKHVPRIALEGVGCTGTPQGSGVHPRPPVGGTGASQVGGTGDTEEPSPPDPDRKYSPLPPNELIEQQQGNVDDRGSTSFVCGNDLDQQANDLVNAFYTALGSDTGSVTLAIRRRDQAIARQLVAAGATAEEAADYARETVALATRFAPVDLRSFERERLGWLARRRSRSKPGAFIDRTGQPPSWQMPLGAPAKTRAVGPPAERADVVGEAFRLVLANALGRPQP
jgi:hypothetical protein